MQKETVYISVDVETTGESPVTSSCIMIGCVVFRDYDVDVNTPNEEWIIDKRHWCLQEVKGRPMTEKCRSTFWNKHIDLLEYIRSNASEPSHIMLKFALWYKNLLEKYNCIFVARPASFDWQWINCVYDEFGPSDKPSLPFSITCISTLKKVAEMFGMPSSHIEHHNIHMTHYADDDALYQAYMYLRINNWIKNKK